MKKHTFTLLLGWLLLLSSNLFAQNPEGLFQLKEGDWFEVQVSDKIQIDNRKRVSSYYYTSHLLRYSFIKQLPNSNQQYNVSIERIKVISMSLGGRSLGFDSYYPTFEENKTTPKIKNQFIMEVAPSGKIVRFDPSKNNKLSSIIFNEIGSIYGRRTFMKWEQDIKDSLTVRNLSSVLMLPFGSPDFKKQTDIYKYSTAELVNRTETQMKVVVQAKVLLKDSLTVKIPYHKNTGIPLLIKLPDIQFVLTNSSFPLENNTFILGKLEDHPNKEVRINMLGNSSCFRFSPKQFRTDHDGSFTCPIFLERPLHLNIHIGNKNLTTFLEPGDTLHFDEIGFLARKLSPVSYQDTSKIEYSLGVLKTSESYTGSAEYNTRLANAINQYQNYYRLYRDAQSIFARSKNIDIKAKKLINSYQVKASEVCLDYFRRDWDYFLAAEKLQFYGENRIPTGQQTYNDVLTIKDYPADFFLGVDTIPILMNPFEWNTSYQNFLAKAQHFKQERLGYTIGRWQYQDFIVNYYFAQASLSGFPLYQQIAQSLDREYRKSTDESFLESYYQDFINNCADPTLKKSIEIIRDNALRIKVGNPFPIKFFALRDSSIFAFDKLKGKPICLIVASGPNSRISNYREVIERFKTEEVEFVFLRLHPNYLYEEKIDSTIKQKSNVTIVDLYDPNLYDKLLLGATRILMLDKWFRIVENNAEDPMTHSYQGMMSEFEKSLRKTIETKRYSKAEKSAMIKTAGWSFGSILFTFLGGLWIYRVRIRRIKQQEAAKRRIKELEIKAIRSQMNPHFIFNALNSIQSLINSNHFKEANIYLSKFAVLLRGVLNNSEKSRISLSDELQAVELYCQLEQLRFEFKFEINIDSDINSDLIEIPGMIIQPLAENAVVHGLSAKGEAGKLNIQAKRQSGNLCVCVADNGVGLSSQKMDELSQKGFGLKLVEERINILNLDGKEAKLTVENRQNTEGTIATLIIPID